MMNGGMNVSEGVTDKRVMRTKRVIRDALTVLMEEKGFEGVTVRNLTEKAKINRGTFYLHYRDKYDLLEQSEEEILQGIEKLIKEFDPIEAIAFTSQSEPVPVILKLFEYFQDNSSFMKVILGPKGNAAFQVKLKELIKKMFLQKIAENLKREDILVPLEFFIAYVSSAHLGVVQQWLESNMEKTPREMTIILTSMTLLGPGFVAGMKK
ncbi:TetR/AcrR family transcriptional regulator [Neobacillus sp. OS1-2]|uniref:TetR/AcrR family transcriptional regulator n=1 Tax=Neobacillus sp. OS1-2 TaxID=3070680 RepID=UPI0027DF8115|nr:TetR/AcrR family transcriptional regulator [Neobacillus sp. OS1-2]WML42248.1 TetR/AcrR family transcriptional regulator [Neobacillus sp. OS1-2]